MKETASTYVGLGFLVDLTGRDDDGDDEGMPSKSGVHLLNISLVIKGPFAKYAGCGVLLPEAS